MESKKSDLSQIPTYTKYWKDQIAPDINSQISGYKPQLNEYGVYRTSCTNCYGDGCSSGNCSAFTTWGNCDGTAGQLYDATKTLYTPDGEDYHSRTDNCFCSTPTICSRANITECWLGNGKNGEEPTYRADWVANRQLKCTFDLNKIDTINQILTFQQKFKPNENNSDYYAIMKKFCMQQRTNCPMDPTTGKPAPSCSLINALGTDPECSACSKWFDNLNEGNTDAFIDEYCKVYPDSAECKCTLRADNEIYKKIKQYFSDTPVEDACIWTPCKGGASLFFRKTAEKHPICPSTFCQNAFNIDKVGGSVTIKDNQSYITCAAPKINDEKKLPLQEIKNPIELYKPILPAKQLVEQSKSKHHIGIAIIVVLFAIIFAIFLFSNHKKIAK